ncbi:MarR family transcriptional regulator [Neobacillus drentensis]|uniref:MarR family transcriptional regulator n=1 Tax=Neobacillus drentensis TaxID=220684 RepID=UPI002FFD8654
MNKDEELSAIFNRVTERHQLIKEMELKKYRFMSENTFLEVHCIDFIEKYPDSNVTKLADALRVTRGAISKTTKKLLEDGAIDKYQKTGNKKEIYFKLTDIGRRIYGEHEKMHQARVVQDQIFFQNLNEIEKDHLIKSLSKIYHEIAVELKNLGLENYI